VPTSRNPEAPAEASRPGLLEGSRHRRREPRKDRIEHEVDIGAEHTDVDVRAVRREQASKLALRQRPGMWVPLLTSSVAVPARERQRIEEMPLTVEKPFDVLGQIP